MRSFADSTDSFIISLNLLFGHIARLAPAHNALHYQVGLASGGSTSSWSSSRSLDRPTPRRHWICPIQPLEAGHSAGPWLSDATARWRGRLTHSLTAARNRLWPMGRSALHVDRSSAIAHASAAVSPVSRTIWLIHVVRGLPAGRFQSWCGVSPDLESATTASEPYVLVCCQADDECGHYIPWFSYINLSMFTYLFYLLAVPSTLVETERSFSAATATSLPAEWHVNLLMCFWLRFIDAGQRKRYGVLQFLASNREHLCFLFAQCCSVDC